MNRTTMKDILCLSIPLAATILLASCNNSDTPSDSSSATIEITTASGVAMVWLPGGEFTIGSVKESADEKPAHKVTLAPFLIDCTEVTGEMFAKAELPNPGHWQDDPKMPVEQIRWRDARAYCNERSLMEGLAPCYDESKPGWPCNFDADGYRLPTEAEWEYAARAGGAGRYGSVDAAKLKQSAWFDANSGNRTHPAGTRKPNDWGLYDMLGNVSEWCQDIYAADYYAKSPAENPQGPEAEGAAAAKRVMRGGNWKSSADMCRVTFRQGQLTGDTDACFTTDYCGFRCVRRATPEELEKLKNNKKRK
jgi:formylglycine-generating enzyme required for sulfatase activity